MAKINEIDITSLLFQEGAAPATPASTKWRAYFKTDGLYVKSDAGTETGPLSGSSSAGLVDYAIATRTSGNITLNSTSYGDLDTGLDLTVTASTGDLLEVGIGGIADTATVFVAFDAVTRVSAADTNYISNGTGTPASLGVSSWFIWQSENEIVRGSWPYVVQAGDVDGGSVVLRFKYKTSAATNRTLRASTSDPLRVWVKNYG